MLPILLLLALVDASSAQRPTPEQAVHVVCNTVGDNEEYWAEIIGQLDALGEAGRSELVRVAGRRDGARPWERGCAWRHLTRLKDARVLPFIRAALRDPAETRENRQTAMAAVGAWNDKPSVRDLVRLLRAPDVIDRSTAADALGLIDSEDARIALREALHDADPPWPVVDALGQQRDGSVVGQLRELSTRMDPDRIYQEAITTALARIGTADSLDLLETILHRMDYRPYRRRAITSALAELRELLPNITEPARRQRIEQSIETLSVLFKRE